MCVAVRAVLKHGVPLIHVSRQFAIPYPTLFYYTNRVRHILKPSNDTEAAPESALVLDAPRPPGKRGRPTKMYLGTWRDEDLTKAIFRVVYKDCLTEQQLANAIMMTSRQPDPWLGGGAQSSAHLSAIPPTVQAPPLVQCQAPHAPPPAPPPSPQTPSAPMIPSPPIVSLSTSPAAPIGESAASVTSLGAGVDVDNFYHQWEGLSALTDVPQGEMSDQGDVAARSDDDV